MTTTITADSTPRPKRPITTGDAALDARIRELASAAGGEKPRELIEELLTTALKMANDQTTVADLKMLNRALKEIRYASRVFAPYRTRHKVSVFGSARTPEEAPESQAAIEFAAEMVRRGWMVITGGGDGIMGAAQKGAGAVNSFGLNIKLPFEQSANETIKSDSKLMNFNYFFTRKLNFVKESHAIALFPGGFGTMDEGFEALTLMQTGKARIFPIVFVDKAGGKYWEELLRFLHDHLLGNRLVSPDDFHLIHHCDTVECAVEHILRFYRNFNSYRWLGPRMIIRLLHPLSQPHIERMNNEFTDVLASGKFEQCEALPDEHSDPEIAHLPRLVFQPHKRNFGRLRKVIDAVSDEE
jgi:uncharacterized protein (TIGR00730 family)